MCAADADAVGRGGESGCNRDIRSASLHCFPFISSTLAHTVTFTHRNLSKRILHLATLPNTTQTHSQWAAATKPPTPTTLPGKFLANATEHTSPHTPTGILTFFFSRLSPHSNCAVNTCSCPRGGCNCKGCPNSVKVEKTTCPCGGDDSNCPCPSGACACSSCPKNAFK